MLILSVYTLISFGFYIAMNAITPVWLQKPVKVGGYGFTTLDNAFCKFLLWETRRGGKILSNIFLT